MFNLNVISNRFRVEYMEYSQTKMAVYGTGNNAKGVLLDTVGFDIAGVVVKESYEGTFCGYPIMSIEEAANIGCKMILIAAEPDIEVVIYDRIVNFCHSKEIAIFGIHLGNMDKLFNEHQLYGFRDYENISKEFVKKQIDDHDAISFDVFDTLLMRRTLYPQDVFFLMEKRIKSMGINIDNFPMQRIHAEVSNPIKQANLDEIYEYLQQMLTLSKEEVDWLKELEIKTEKTVLAVKEPVYDLLRYAKQKGKEVYLISDMYLPEHILKKLVSNTGIEEYDGIFVSNEYRTGKTEELYDEYVKNNRDKKLLHIGDNKKADGICAITHGLDAIILPNALDVMEKSSIADVLTRTSNVSERLMVGLFVMRIFSNPFSETYEIKEVQDYAYLFLGPVVSEYMLWLLEEIEANRFTKILFAARDGWLFLRLYQMAKEQLELELPEGIYFYTSRKACIRSYCADKSGLSEVLDRYTFTMDDIGRNFSSNGKTERLSEEEVLVLGKKERAGYQKYIESIHFNSNEYIGFVDLASGGTCQYFLEELFLPKMTGLYFCQTGSTAKRMPVIHSALREWSEQTQYFSRIDHKVLIEAVISSPEPSLGGFLENGDPVFMPDNRSESDKQFIMEAQEGIAEFFSDFIKISIGYDHIHPAITRALLGYKDIARVSREILSHIHLEDELINVSFGAKKG